MKHLALLRGINVGGNNMIRMGELKLCLQDAGFQEVSTYIQSGNVIFSAAARADRRRLAGEMATAIEATFGMSIAIALFTARQWRQILEEAPGQWGTEAGFRHNLLVMIEPFVMEDVVSSIGELKPEIEMLVPGRGVLYHSISIEAFNRATTGRLASMPVYKQMTIRNYNTATKLRGLL